MYDGNEQLRGGAVNELRTLTPRLDEYSRYKLLTDSTGKVIGGDFLFAWARGDLEYAAASVLFVVDLNTGSVWPITSVVRLDT